MSGAIIFDGTHVYLGYRALVFRMGIRIRIDLVLIFRK
jgi:hypothetical protein